MALKHYEILSMDKINWWLLKYYENYKATKKLEQSKYLYDIESIIVRLPEKSLKNTNELFLDIYDALEMLAEFHKNESYFEKEVKLYVEVKNSKNLLQKWLKRNETLGSEIYACFIIDYLDYSEDPFHLNVFIHSIREIEIYVDGKDFENTVQFLEIFNELYWV